MQKNRIEIKKKFIVNKKKQMESPSRINDAHNKPNIYLIRYVFESFEKRDN